MVNLLGAGSGKLLHYVVLQHCPLTWALQGDSGDTPERTSGGNVVQIKRNAFAAVGPSLFPPLEMVREVNSTVAKQRYFLMITIS